MTARTQTASVSPAGGTGCAPQPVTSSGAGCARRAAPDISPPPHPLRVQVKVQWTREITRWMVAARAAGASFVAACRKFIVENDVVDVREAATRAPLTTAQVMKYACRVAATAGRRVTI